MTAAPVRFVFLGTSAALPSKERDTTSIVVARDGAAVLLDCGGSPVQKLLRAGVPPLSLVRVIITHVHADHAYGLPSLVQGLMLLGRAEALPVSCREEHVEPLRQLLAVFRLLDRPGMFPICFEPVPARTDAPLPDSAGLAISASPNAHGSMPNFAVRITPPGPGRAVVYSSDTEPCDAVVSLARGADTLIHDATFADRGESRSGSHSTAAEAGEIAARAGVRRLILAHVGRDHHGAPDRLVALASTRFGGVVEVARELVPYSF